MGELDETSVDFFHEPINTDAGDSLSKASKNSTNQKIVYTVLIGNSAAVNNSGNRDTCPATAKGLNAPRYLRSCKAIRLKGIMINKMAFSWTCHPKRNDE